jgi:hypothetical protein
MGLQQNGSHCCPLIVFGTQEERHGSEVRDRGQIHFFDRMRLWFRADERGANRKNALTASGERSRTGALVRVPNSIGA